MHTLGIENVESNAVWNCEHFRVQVEDSSGVECQPPLRVQPDEPVCSFYNSAATTAFVCITASGNDECYDHELRVTGPG